jgi:dTDP-3-amino-3,4,6-trideoxy-alpha-D-glucose transaminase
MNIVADLFVPQASPKLKIARHASAISTAIDAVLRGDSFILGPQHNRFEDEFAAYLGSPHCVGVSSGTDALVLALQALGIGLDDHVLVPAMSAPATAAAVLRVGAKIRFVDIEPTTRAIDPHQIASRITAKTKAIILVHLHGIPAAIDEIITVARRFGLPLVEDCAQAQGVLVNGRHAGTFGDLAAFSFYPTKNLGCVGDGGCVVAASPELAERVRRLRNYGFDERGQCIEPGGNHRTFCVFSFRIWMPRTTTEKHSPRFTIPSFAKRATRHACRHHPTVRSIINMR